MGNLSFDFTGRTAIVTGAARGIGLELARLLHQSGAAVITSIPPEKKAELAAAVPMGRFAAPAEMAASVASRSRRRPAT